MRKKVLWVFLTILIVMAMILASCNGEVEEDEGGTTVKGEVTTPAPETSKPEDTTREEKPRYGGIATIALSSNISAFDDTVQNQAYTSTLHLTNEELLQGDWTKGAAGTGEADFVHGGVNKLSLKAGCLADTWEIPERGKMIFHIREGVYWHNKPPTNGRELTVDDVIFSLERMCTAPGAYIKVTYPNLAKTIKFTGDETTRMLTIECSLEEWPNVVTLFPDFVMIYPRDAVEEFGDMNEWQNSIGTGAFILSDYISNGSVTLVRNDNYWETNPIGPGKGDQLPYIDGVKMLIIPDTSTRMSAIRTGKIDGTSGEYDDVKEFLENPDIKTMLYTADYCYAMYMRTDMPESPFSKKEVRQALTMAMDYDMVKDDFYGGKAVILNWPLAYTKESAEAYVPMEDLPANVQELYSHNVTKAKDLLTNAGYPNGFDTTVICYNTPTHVDFLSLVQSMWAEIGVNLKIDAKEYAIWMSRMRSRNYSSNELLYTYSSAIWTKMINFQGISQYNASFVDDPVVNEAFLETPEYIGVDEAKLAEIHAGLMPYVIEQCWAISKPSPYSYVIWWPWVKNWNGELHVGYYNYPSYQKYRWLDADLRQQMTGKY